MSQNNRSRTLYCIESGTVLAAALEINKDLGAFPVTTVCLVTDQMSTLFFIHLSHLSSLSPDP